MPPIFLALVVTVFLAASGCSSGNEERPTVGTIARATEAVTAVTTSPPTPATPVPSPSVPPASATRTPPPRPTPQLVRPLSEGRLVLQDHDSNLYLLDGEVVSFLGPGNAHTLAPSPDGRLFAYPEPYYLPPMRFYVRDRSGEELLVLEGSGESFDWSADSRSIALTLSEAGWNTPRHLLLLDVETRELRQLTEGKVVDNVVGWTADGQVLVARFLEGGSFLLLSIDPTSGETTTLATPAPAIYFDLSPDRRHLAMYSASYLDFELWVMRADGSDLRRLVSWREDASAALPSAHGLAYPAAALLLKGPPTVLWRPDSSGLLYDRFNDERRTELRLVSLDGAESVWFGVGGELSWSPDGRLIMAWSWEDDSDQRLSVLDLQESGSGFRPILVGEGMAFAEGEVQAMPLWSPSGEYVAIWARRAVYVCRLEGGCDLIARSPNAYPAAWLP